jgi:predicted dehydrogenase
MVYPGSTTQRIEEMKNKQKNSAEEKISKTISIGLVGFGGIGKLHTANWRNLHLYYPDLPVKLNLRGAAARTQDTADRAVQQGGFEYGTTDYQELMDDPEINLIDICTPNNLHYPIFKAALVAGKHIYCEKPLALNIQEAEEMLTLAEASDRVVQLAFNYRFIPAVMRAKQLIEEGFLGEVINFRAQYFHTGYLNPDKPISWRLDQEASGGGALVDLGSHVIDLMLYLAGPFNRVLAQTKTFVKQRPVEVGSRQKAEVMVDDHAQLLVDLVGGGAGIIEVSRVAQGTTDDLNFEIHGSKGAIKFDVMDPNWLYIYDAGDKKEPLGGENGFKQVQTMHSYPSNAIPGARSMVNPMSMHANSQYQMILAATGRQPASPTTRDGYLVQQVLDASYRSAREETWVDLPKRVGI